MQICRLACKFFMQLEEESIHVKWDTLYVRDKEKIVSDTWKSLTYKYMCLYILYIHVCRYVLYSIYIYVYK